MGAPPGWGPNWKKIQESDKFNRERGAKEKRRKAATEAEAEEKRGLEILKNGDLVRNVQCRQHGGRHSTQPKNHPPGIIIEAGYRSFVDVLVNGKVHRWNRENIEVICESR